MCESKELIVGFVYDELSADERAGFEAHLAVCAGCRIEIEELRSTRGHLALWAPPEPDFGFRVIRGAAAPAAAAPWRARVMPAFAYAAAAVLVLAAAAAIANVEVRYDNGGMVVRTGWAPVQEASQTAAPTGSQQTNARSTSQPQPDRAATADFAALEQRLREIEAILSRGPATGVQLASDSRLSDAEILRRVRQIVAEAEARQEAAVARQMLDVVKDFDRQRRTDLALIQQGLDQYQGLTNAEIAQNRDLVNQIIRAATTRQER